MPMIVTFLGFDAGVYHPTHPDERFPNASKRGGTRSRGRILRITKSAAVSIRLSNGQVKRLRHRVGTRGVLLNQLDVANILNSKFSTRLKSGEFAPLLP
jgi:hypothetical protein